MVHIDHTRSADYALQSALSKLMDRIEDGQEFPDACWSVSCRSNSVSYEALANAYDEATGASK